MSESSATVPRPRIFYTEPDWIDVGDVRVAYRRQGVGEPTIFLHGAGGTRMWLPFYQQMAGSVDFIAPEHPGFGETEAPEWRMGFDDLVLHYRDFADALGLDRFHLVGFSVGGWIAAEFAIFYPQRLESMTLIAPAGLYVPGKPLVDLFAMPPERIATCLFSGREAEYLDYLPDGTNLDDIVHAYGEMISYASLTWAPHHDPKLPRRLARLQVPTLLVGAEDDWIVPTEHVDRYAELMPGARSVRIPETGHGLIMQEPERAAQEIVSFIQGSAR
jgi:pimeloyl-ACP methyl ester carboxylesterase